MYQKANNLGQNSLERGFGGCKTYPKPNPKRPKVTIAIGFMFRAGPEKMATGEIPAIVMASDSQSTYGGTKRENPNKINLVNFANGQILIAQSDSVELGDRTIEKLRSKAKGIRMEDSETAVMAVRAAMLEVRNELLEWNKGHVSDLQNFFWTEHRLNFLVGYFFKEKPYLFKMNIYSGIPSPVTSFDAIGGGEPLGYFLLKEYAQANPDFDHAVPIAVSVVEKVIDSVDGCGRPTWVGYVYPLPIEIQIRQKTPPELVIHCHAAMLPQRESELVARELKISEAHGSALRKTEIVKAMNRVSRKLVALELKIARDKIKQGGKRTLVNALSALPKPG